ncbi:hypothetical protein ACFQ3F_17505 [Nocardioides ginsengisoli]|uniref:Uncharacterized protein n=1 Tax=Nocardioides ginsengisoli TaxID=363868 RepID=A0ABW3W522_9ACTN
MASALYAPAATAAPKDAPAVAAPAVSSGTTASADNILGDVLSNLDGVLEAVVGARVTAWWIPGQHTAEVGAELPIQKIGSVLTLGDGSFTLPLRSTQKMVQEAAANGGVHQPRARRAR